LYIASPGATGGRDLCSPFRGVAEWVATGDPLPLKARHTERRQSRE
jgi:hypothetical protein